MPHTITQFSQHSLGAEAAQAINCGEGKGLRMPWRRPPWRLPTCSLPWRNGCGRRRPQGSRSPLPAAVQRRGQRRTPARRRSRSQSVLPLTFSAWRTSGIQASTVFLDGWVSEIGANAMSSVANACTRAAHACTKFLRGHLGFRCSCARLRIRSLWARNAHLCTSSARGARLVPFQHAAGHVQAASSPRYPAQGARTVEEVHTENICTHTHRQLSPVRHFSPHTLPSARWDRAQHQERASGRE